VGLPAETPDTAEPLASGVRAPSREQALFASVRSFLTTELAPSTLRWRATARTLSVCLIAALLIVWLHIPDGHWIIMTILVVHQPNAGGSVRRGLERIAGTVAGSISAILTIIAFAQQPWFAFPLVGFLIALGLFISRTSVVPYVALLAAITDALFLSAGVLEPDEAVIQGLWRMLLISGGVILATGAHLLLWPVEPERQLLRGLALTLDRVAAALRCLALGRDDARAEQELTRAAVGDIPGQVALLQATESRHFGLRRRHAEHLVLVGSVSRLATAAATLVAERPRAALDEIVNQHLTTLADRCEVHARALEVVAEDVLAGGAAPSRSHVSPLPSAAPVLAEATTALAAGGPRGSSPTARAMAHLIEMEQALAPVPRALDLIRDPGQPGDEFLPRSVREEVSEPRFLTSAFSLRNTTDMVFALKGGLAAMLAQAAALGLAMSSPSTATVTAVIVAQGTVGATLQKALLRIAGAIVGGLLAVAAMVLVFPTIQSVALFLAVAAVGLGVAAYVTAGGPRTAYVGIQIGMAFAMSVLDTFGPATDLTVPRDRVLGIVLGIALFTLIDFSFAPVFAGRESQRRIASALRATAELSRHGIGTLGAAERAAAAAARPLTALRRQIVDDLTAALQREDEALFEPGGRSELERTASRLRLAVLHQTQTTFLLVLAIVRDRMNLDFEGVPMAERLVARSFARSVGPHLEAIADRIEGRPTADVPPLAPLLEELERIEAASLADAARFAMVAQSGFYRELGPMLAELERSADAYAGWVSSRSRVSPS
jgi:multidrug resistance protein MdtO